MASKRRSSARRTSASVPFSSLTAVAMAPSLASHSRQGRLRLGSTARRDDVLAEHLDGGQRPLVRDGFRLGDEDDLIHAGLLVELHPLDAAVRVTGDDDAAVA